ncbi:MAG TPA: hypothetical protein VM370_07065 [Candidatus Thermoplasmatota archaeon]|nr:hypothetical protein [Candidatus Thermoplasmatota archaeon]
MLRAATATLAFALLSGCALPFFPDCTPRLASVSWKDARVYAALADPSAIEVGIVTQEILAPGLARIEDPLVPEVAVTREVRWTDGARQGDLFAPGAGGTRVSFSFAPNDTGAPAAFERFLDAIVSGAAAREALAADMRAGEREGMETRSYEATTEAPLRLGDFAWLRGNEGEPAIEDHEHELHLVWSNWTYVFSLPSRSGTFPNDSSGRTTTDADDGLPYFHLVAFPGGRVHIQHGEGNSRLGMDEAETRQWANESFAAARLPTPTCDEWRAEWATCL